MIRTLSLRHLAILLPAAWARLTLLAPTRALAADEDDEKSGVLTTWTLTAGGTAIGSETLRVVNAPSGSFFASGELKVKDGKGKIVLKSHVQRDADGKVAKYRRVEGGRKGKGLFLFNKDGAARIVGVNTDDKPGDVGAVLGQHIWDPAIWHDLALLTGRLKGDGPVSVSYFDVEARKSGTASLTRGASTQVTDAKGGLVPVVVWKIGGAPGSAKELYVDGKQQLVGVRGGDRAMLLKGYTWADGTKAGEAAADDGKADDEGEEGEGGVGP